MQPSTVKPTTLEGEYDNSNYQKIMLKVFNKFGDIEEDSYREISLMALHKALNKYQPNRGTKFTSFLTTVMKSECKMMRRRLRAKIRMPFVPLDFDVQQKEVSLSEDVNECLALLGEDENMILYLKYYENMEDEQIRLQLGLDDRGYYSLLLRAEGSFRAKYRC